MREERGVKFKASWPQTQEGHEGPGPGGGRFSRSVASDSCDPVDRSPPGSSAQGISQARVLEWAAISFSRGSSRPRNRTQVSCIEGRFFTD